MPETEKIKITHSEKNFSLSIYCKIDDNGTIKQLAYHNNNSNPWQKKLETIAQQAVGCSIGKIPYLLLQEDNRNTDPVIDLPFMLLRKSLLKYRGIPDCHISILNKQKDQLICRCFGVYRKSLENFIWQKTEVSLKDVTNQLRATGGCFRCLPDVNKMLALANTTPVQLACKVDNLKGQWLAQNNKEDIQMDIMEVDKNKISFYIRPGEQADDLIYSFQDYLDIYCPGLLLSSF